MSAAHNTWSIRNWEFVVWLAAALIQRTVLAPPVVGASAACESGFGVLVAPTKFGLVAKRSALLTAKSPVVVSQCNQSPPHRWRLPTSSIAWRLRHGWKQGRHETGCCRTRRSLVSPTRLVKVMGHRDR